MPSRLANAKCELVLTSSNSQRQYSVLRAFEINQSEFGERVGLGPSLMW